MVEYSSRTCGTEEPPENSNLQETLRQEQVPLEYCLHPGHLKRPVSTEGCSSVDYTAIPFACGLGGATGYDVTEQLLMTHAC